MSSFFDELQTAIGSPVALEFHGEPVTHWPLHVPANAVPLTAIFDETPEPEVKYDRGKGVIRKGVLQVASSVAVSKKDAWIIKNDQWETESLGRNEGELRDVHLIRREGIKTQTQGNTRRGR